MKILIAVMLMVIANEAWAHSFNLGFVAPMQGSRANSGQQALDGFMLATTEQDTHAFEESDGHLGGLDCYVIQIDSSVNEKTTIDRVEHLLKKDKPLFVAGIFSSELAGQISDRLEDSEAVLVNPVESLMWRQLVEYPDKLTTMSGAPFKVKFKATYGYDPTADVRKGYIAARLIASTVRSLPESQLEDREQLARALRQFQQE
jgi:ABC-type branched-subunit amino acid transport system substrate-binding protein